MEYYIIAIDESNPTTLASFENKINNIGACKRIMHNLFILKREKTDSSSMKLLNLLLSGNGDFSVLVNKLNSSSNISWSFFPEESNIIENTLREMYKEYGEQER